MKKLHLFIALALIIAVLVAWPHGFRLVISHLATLDRLWTPAAPTRIWAESGAVIIPAVAQVTASRNAPGQALNAEQKKYLRLMFGDLVDRAQVNYNSKLVDRWSSSDQATQVEIHVGTVHSSAQTFCDRIYLRNAYLPQDTAQLVRLAHELTHFQQCERFGGIRNFGYQYFYAYQQADRNYVNNQLEKESLAGEQQFIKTLCQQIDCQNPQDKSYIYYKGVDVKLPVLIK